MRLAAPADKGEWFVFTEDEATGEKVEFQVRRVPAGFVRQLEMEVHGRKRQSKYRKGYHILEYDAAQSEELIHRKAAYALLDSRNAEMPAGEVPALAAPESAPHDFVTLDGRWTSEVKAQAFRSFPDLALWINSRADSLEVKGREDEEGKGETS